MNPVAINKLEIMQGDITRLSVDAIVNAANKTLLGGGGVDGAIHRAAGPRLLEACRKLGGCETGLAKITKGYDLPARYVIHTVWPVYRGTQEDAKLLAGCYRNSLQLALDHQLSSVAFPAISCGVYGYPIGDASEIALKTTLDYIEYHPDIHKVIFVLFSQKDLEVYKTALDHLTGNLRKNRGPDA